MKIRPWIASVVPAILCASGVLSAQAARPEWGVSSSSAEVISAWDMQPSMGSGDWSFDFAGHRYVTSGLLIAGVHVPQGAKISAIVIDGCDFAPDGGVEFTLNRATADSNVVLATAQSGGPDTPGCSLFGASLAVPETADYNQYRYWISGGNQTVDGNTLVGAVRILYQLQVSPPPGTATFNDVPVSDPAFQFVEALVASGITAGCGSGNFCPDAPLTRRQMAVFLAKALGLQWPASGTF
jgi:hypothetical protein